MRASCSSCGERTATGSKLAIRMSFRGSDFVGPARLIPQTLKPREIHHDIELEFISLASWPFHSDSCD
jgi:hypothetical protein